MCLFVSSASAAQVDLVLLAQEKVILSIDGERHTLVVGQRSPDGVKLISIGADSAVLEVDGKRRSYMVGQTGSVSTRFDSPEVREITINSDAAGMFLVQGSVNGSSAQFLVDTGATLVTLNGSQARRLGLDYKRGQRIPMATASGNTVGYVIRLDRVKVASLELFQVDAVVLDGDAPPFVLLGSTFLSRVEMTRSGRVMTLRKK